MTEARRNQRRIFMLRRSLGRPATHAWAKQELAFMAVDTDISLAIRRAAVDALAGAAPGAVRVEHEGTVS